MVCSKTGLGRNPHWTYMFSTIKFRWAKSRRRKVLGYRCHKGTQVHVGSSLLLLLRRNLRRTWLDLAPIIRCTRVRTQKGSQLSSKRITASSNPRSMKNQWSDKGFQRAMATFQQTNRLKDFWPRVANQHQRCKWSTLALNSKLYQQSTQCGRKLPSTRIQTLSIAFLTTRRQTSTRTQCFKTTTKTHSNTNNNKDLLLQWNKRCFKPILTASIWVAIIRNSTITCKDTSKAPKNLSRWSTYT